MSTHAPYRILTVSTGNICRTPLAERLLRAGFDAMTSGDSRSMVLELAPGLLRRTFALGKPAQRQPRMVRELTPAMHTLPAWERADR